ncbi:hypothetical protein G6F22_021975 [Rhizopus arrhizus]|nr:hypothetical protein G6F22_021975 [Rhizopus arrhizus]
MEIRPEVVVHGRVDPAGHKQMDPPRGFPLRLRDIRQQLGHAAVDGLGRPAGFLAGVRDRECGVVPLDQPPPQLIFQAL